MPRKNVILSDTASDVLSSFGRGSGQYMSNLVLQRSAAWRQAHADLAEAGISNSTLLTACRSLVNMTLYRRPAEWVACALRSIRPKHTENMGLLIAGLEGPQGPQGQMLADSVRVLVEEWSLNNPALQSVLVPTACSCGSTEPCEPSCGYGDDCTHGCWDACPSCGMV